MTGITQVRRSAARSGWGEIIIDTMVAASLATGFILMLFYFLGFGADWLLIASFSLLFCLVTGLLFRHWWILPGLILAAGLFLALSYWQASWWDGWIRFLVAFFQWAANRLLLGGPEPPFELWMLWLRLLLILVLSWPVLAIVRLAGRLLFMAIPSLLIAIPFLFYYPEQIVLILPILAGLIVFLPASMIQSVQADHPDARLPRAPLQFLAIPVAILCVLAGQFITPEDTSRWRQQDWINRLGDWRDLWLNQSATGRSWKPFSISFAGFQPADQQLGGPVKQNDQTYLEVYAENPVLLRSVTRSIYTGHSWQTAQSQVYRFGSPLWWLVDRQVFTNDLPGGEDGDAFRAQFFKVQTVSVKPRTPWMSSIFSAGRVQRIVWSLTTAPRVYFTNDGDLFTFDFAAGSYDYQLLTQIPDRQGNGFQAAMLKLESATDERNKDPYWKVVSNRYLQLPDNLPAIVAETASSIMGDGESPYDKAVLLETYLREQFKYTLEPEPVPTGMDFVAHVLDIREGYCVHFASAMTVMARTAGIPARYVEGFALEPGQVKNTWYATGKTAHAWAELYFKGIGWLTFDPTPAGRTAPIDEPTDPGTPAVSPEPSPSPSPPPVPVTPVDEADKGPGWPLLLLGGSLILLAALVPFLLILFRRRHLHRILPENMQLRWPDRTECLDLTYQDILHQLSCLKIQPEIGETLSVFADRAEHYLRFGSLNLTDVLWPVARWRYGGHRPSEENLDQILDLHVRLEGRLRESLNRPSWFFNRVLHRFPTAISSFSASGSSHKE